MWSEPCRVTVREVVLVYRRTAEWPRLKGPDAVAAFVRNEIGDATREHFLAVYFDGRHAPIAFQSISIGTATASLVHPREVFQPAIAVGACAVVLAHNHPSGDPDPSSEDRALTERIVKAGEILGIPLLDHVVIGLESHVSLRELGLCS